METDAIRPVLIPAKSGSADFERESFTRIQVFTHDSKFYAEQVNEGIVFAGVSKDTSVIRRILGIDAAESIELLTKAVNNRTRERNYFRLYSEMLDGTISEEEFDRQIEDHEDQYVVTGEEVPSLNRLARAVHLSSGIMDADTSESISSLFSFDSVDTDQKLLELEANGSF